MRDWKLKQFQYCGIFFANESQNISCRKSILQSKILHCWTICELTLYYDLFLRFLVLPAPIFFAIVGLIGGFLGRLAARLLQRRFNSRFSVLPVLTAIAALYCTRHFILPNIEPLIAEAEFAKGVRYAAAEETSGQSLVSAIVRDRRGIITIRMHYGIPDEKILESEIRKSLQGSGICNNLQEIEKFIRGVTIRLVVTKRRVITVDFDLDDCSVAPKTDSV